MALKLKKSQHTVMSRHEYRSYSLGMIVLLVLSTTAPVFAEVTSLQTNLDSFFKGQEIEFSGTVEEGSTGLVTIVIHDLNNEFVLLTQAMINPDDSFEKTVKIEDRFSKHGMYDATGFILNMTRGVTTDFGIVSDSVPITLDEEKMEEVEEPISYNNIKKEPVQETVPTTRLIDFVDSSKDPQYYIDRYYNEEAYKSWFDRNYPGLTIEEAVNPTANVNEIKSAVQELIDKEIIPEVQASSLKEPLPQKTNNSEIAEISLAVAGLGILFGAVYGVKRKVDDNSRQISINRNTIRKRFIQPIIGSNPKEIIQTRLAKGEITLEEYEKLKSKLN